MLSCNCYNSQYNYASHGHVIITSLLMKSLDHWYQKEQNIGNIILSNRILTKNIIMDAIDNYVRKWYLHAQTISNYRRL